MIVRFSLFVDWTGLLIKGYWQENRWKRENFEVFYLCSLLSNTLFIRKQNGLKCASKWKPYRANIVCKKWFLFQVEIKKKCYWNCWFGPSNRPNQQIKLQPTSWQYPLIDYLEIAYPLRIQGMLKMGNFHEDMFYSAYLTYLCLKVHSPREEIYSHNHKRNLSGEGRRVLKKYEESVNFRDFSKMALGFVV